MRYKEYKLGDVFSVESVNKLSIPGKNYIMDRDIVDKDGTAPYIAAISTNNGITGYSSKYDVNNKGDCITLSTTADSSNTVFYQEGDFIGRQQIAGIRRKDGQYMGHYIGLYIVSIIKKITSSFNYSNKLTKDFLRNCIISLPVKTALIPDFESLEILAGGGTDMSNIDTSSWKEFKVSEVFGKAKLGKYHNPTDLIEDKHGYPYICASNQNNGINSQMPRVNGLNLVLTPAKIIAWGKQCPMFTYHDERCVTSQGMYYLDLTDYSENVALFICSALSKACEGKYSYSNCLIGSVMDEITIKLPIKESEEINWEYMQERISELEQERISELEQYLIAAGLNDYELTDEDKEILATKLTDGGGITKLDICKWLLERSK